MASIPGHIIPALALGIPGSAPSAVLLAAMVIHGIQPGPMMMIQHPQFIYEVVAMTSLATVSILIFGLFLVKPLAARAAHQAHRADADHLPALHRRRLRQRVAPVRHLLHAGDRHRRLLPAPARLPDGALRARPRPRRPARQEPAPRPGVVRRQPRALLHAADLDGIRDGHDLHLAALRAAVQGRGAALHRRRRRDRARAVPQATRRRGREHEDLACATKCSATCRSKRNASWPPVSATTVSRSRRSPSPKRPSASTRAKRRAFARIVEASGLVVTGLALAAGQAGRPVGDEFGCRRARVKRSRW